MKTLKDFTPEIKAKIPEYQKKCLNGIINNVDFPLDNTVKYVQRIYELAGFDKPIVIQANGVLEYRILFDFFSKDSDSLRDSLGDSLYNSLYNSLNDSLRDSLDNSLDNSLRDSLYNSLDNSLRNSLRNSLGDSLYNSLNDSSRDSLGDSLGDSLYNSLNDSLRDSLNDSLDNSLRNSIARSHWAWYCSIYSRVYFTWYKFIQDEFNIEHDKKDILNELYELSINSNISRCFFGKKMCLVLKTPKNVKFENNVLHSVETPSYEYIGFKKYHIRGVEISEEMFNKLSNKEYTFEDFVKEPNEEIKNCALAFMEEKWGSSYLFDFLSKNLTEVDTFTDKKDSVYLEGTTKGMNIGVYTLFKGEVNDVDLAFVRCYCPSTDRMFFLGVNPDNSNAKDAIASLYRVPRKLASDIKYIQRQGERFSTVFNDISKAEKLTKEELNDLVCLSGDKYFELMKYEY